MKVRLYKTDDYQGDGYAIDDVRIDSWAGTTQAVLKCRKVGSAKKLTIQIDEKAVWEFIAQLQEMYPNAVHWKTLSERKKGRK